MPSSNASHDVIVMGGGPAGSTAALVLARAGLNVVLLERSEHPRFHIGESFLPRNFQLIRDLGLMDRLNAIPHTVKLGAEFGFGDNRRPTTRFRFSQQLGNGESEAFNIERAPFDAMLKDAARDAGAVIRQNTQVKRIINLEENNVSIALNNGEEVRASHLIDATGQATIIGRHLKTRRVLPHLRKIAYFGHFHNVKRLQGDEEGYPTIVMCDEGWFWIIPLDQTKTSIGLVMHADLTKDMKVPSEQMLRWGIARCPLVRERTANAVFPEVNFVTADFSYRCEPYAGPGYFLVGDAATFVDPIFSTGVCLGMMGAVEAANGIVAIRQRKATPQSVRRKYINFVNGSTSAFFRMVAHYYNHAFRELFMQGKGPMQIHSAVIGTLAGHVFPRPAWSLRWRLLWFELIIKWQGRFELAPRRPSFSLMNETPVDHVPPSSNLAATEMELNVEPHHHLTNAMRDSKEGMSIHDAARAPTA